MIHRKTVRHGHEPGELHELTFSCYKRLPLLTNDDWRTLLARSIDEANRVERVKLVGFVFMPEHVHMLIKPKDPANPIGRYLARVKQPFSRQVREMLEASRSELLARLTIRERPGKDCFRFWQEGSGYDRNLVSPAAIEASLTYIHENPVARGLCRNAVDWAWSSARFYQSDGPAIPEIGVPVVHGLPAHTFL